MTKILMDDPKVANQIRTAFLFGVLNGLLLLITPSEKMAKDIKAFGWKTINGAKVPLDSHGEPTGTAGENIKKSEENKEEKEKEPRQGLFDGIRSEAEIQSLEKQYEDQEVEIPSNERNMLYHELNQNIKPEDVKDLIISRNIGDHEYHIVVLDYAHYLIVGRKKIK